MTIDEVVADMKRQINDVIEANLLEAGTFLLDGCATEDELNEALRRSHADSQASAGEALDRLRTVLEAKKER